MHFFHNLIKHHSDVNYLSLCHGEDTECDIVISLISSGSTLQVFDFPVFTTLVPSCSNLFSIYA
jgi:hypothetical protein